MNKTSSALATCKKCGESYSPSKGCRNGCNLPWGGGLYAGKGVIHHDVQSAWDSRQHGGFVARKVTYE